MPQMAPMNWLFLYFLFTMIFLMFNFMNYYIFMINSKIHSIMKNKINKMNWKW
uniref:ATP synthase complex subunit 8 n=1 Tax=Macrogyrus oblongus TaxID=528226 RepID=C8YXA7_9COLE|nr:ATP synthase F0 subunit 8 [Macrogyrus oblongus]ACO92541.1 ATP synthase F0 subunit 8 [Macrogyrus oblongus]